MQVNKYVSVFILLLLLPYTTAEADPLPGNCNTL